MPWVAGKSGNPLGRTPDNNSIKKMLERIGNQLVDTSVGKMRKSELLWIAIYNEGIKGDIRAAAIIADRLEGKAAQSIDMTTNGKDMAPTVVNVDESKISPEQLEKIFEVIQNARLS